MCGRIMDEYREYLEKCLGEFEEALIAEKAMEIPNDSMIRVLAQEIQYCKGALL